MSEEIKKTWDNTEKLAVKAWYESNLSFDHVEKEDIIPHNYVS